MMRQECMILRDYQHLRRSVSTALPCLRPEPGNIKNAKMNKTPELQVFITSLHRQTGGSPVRILARKSIVPKQFRCFLTGPLLTCLTSLPPSPTAPPTLLITLLQLRKLCMCVLFFKWAPPTASKNHPSHPDFPKALANHFK